jgi:uncharacterized protein with GYD domain
MATFIGLLSYTDQGIRTVGHTTEQPAALNDITQIIGQSHYEVYWALEKHDITIKAFYWTQGAYDAVLLMDATDAEAAMAAFLCLDSLGNFRTHTLRAFTKEEMDKITANCS